MNQVQPIYFPDVQVADHFGVTIEECDFFEDAWFPGGMQVCTVKVACTNYDVFFGSSGKIELVILAEAA